VPRVCPTRAGRAAGSSPPERAVVLLVVTAEQDVVRRG
jgi:hypothetical protein